MKSKEYLKKLVREIKWGEEKELPFSQGYAINTVIGRYKIPAKRWGYNRGSHIGVETKNQYLLWKDTGVELEFMGIVNKEKQLYKKGFPKGV